MLPTTQGLCARPLDPPDLLGNLSLTELADHPGWPKQKLSMLHAGMRKRFGFQSRSMKSVSAVAYRERFERMRDDEAHKARMAENQFDLFAKPELADENKKAPEIRGFFCKVVFRVRQTLRQAP